MAAEEGGKKGRLSAILNCCLKDTLTLRVLILGGGGGGKGYGVKTFPKMFFALGKRRENLPAPLIVVVGEEKGGKKGGNSLALVKGGGSVSAISLLLSSISGEEGGKYDVSVAELVHDLVRK